MKEYRKEEMIEKDKKYVWHHLVQHKPYLEGEPPVMVDGHGCTVINIHGQEFLDCVSGGVWCVNVGYGRKRIADAVHNQLTQMPYYAMSAGNIPAIELSEKIASLMPRSSRKVFYSNSGSEANEKAFKMARLYSRLNSGCDKYKILYRHRDYHGTTIATLSATGQDERRMGFEPLVPGFEMVPECHCYRCPFGKTYPNCDIDCALALEEAILRNNPDSVAAFIVEPITAGGGILVPVPEYFPIVQEICERHGVLLIMDEVVCGFGRTGTWFGYQHFDVNPDIVTMAKGMASAYQAISATVVKDKIYNKFINDPGDKFKYFRDISTYGGCAASAAAALENINIIEEEDLLQRVRLMGAYLFDNLGELRGLDVVGDIRGQGLFAGIELVADRETKEPVPEAKINQIAAYAMQQGVLIGRMNRSVPGHNTVLTLAPAYVVTKDELDRMVATIKNAIETVF